MATGTSSPTPKPRSGALGIETRSIDYVPLRERHGKVWHLFPVWFAGEAHLGAMAVGIIGIALGGNLIWTAIAVVLGVAIGTFFMAFHSTQGPQLGLPQMVQSRPQFGYIGALLVWVVALVTYIGYNGMGQVLTARTLTNLADVPPSVSYIGYALIAGILAIIGYDFIHKASQWLTYVMFIIFIVFTLGIFIASPFTAAQLDIGDFSLSPFLIQMLTAAVYQLSWSIYVSDYSRYLPPNVGVKSSFWWTFLGAGIGGSWAMLIGTVAAGLFPQQDAIQQVISAGDVVFQGFGHILLISAVVPLITIGTLNFYGASLTLLSCLDSIKSIKPTVGKRIACLIVIGIASTLIAFGSTDSFIEQFGNFLIVLGLLFTPWTAINLVDFFFVRRGHYSIREIFNPHGIYKRWNWRGMLAYWLGFAAMLPFAIVGPYEGPIAKALGSLDITMPIGLAVASLVYLVACRSLDVEAERILAAAADVGLDPDAVPVHEPALRTESN